MNRDSNKQSAIILAVIGILPVVWLGLLIAPSVKGGLPEILPSLLTAFNDPFHIELCGDSLKTVLVLLLLYGMGIGIYLSTRRNYRRREEHGSAKWGSAKAIDKKYRQSPPSENKLMTQNVRIGLNAKKHRRNLNTLVCGGSGAGKTRFYCKPNLMQTSNSSQVILDPKGEILRDVGNLLEKAGYEIKVLDLISMEKSHCYNPFVYLRNDNDIQRLVTNLFKSTTPKGSQSNDPFWDTAASMLLLALIFYLHYEAPEEEQNFAMVMEMLRAAAIEDEEDNRPSPLDNLFADLEMDNPDHIALKYYRSYHSGSAKTLKSIQITLAARLEKFNLESLAALTSADELDLASMGEKKTALFALIPDNDSSFNFLVSILYTQLFQQLCAGGIRHAQRVEQAEQVAHVAHFQHPIGPQRIQRPRRQTHRLLHLCFAHRTQHLKAHLADLFKGVALGGRAVDVLVIVVAQGLAGGGLRRLGNGEGHVRLEGQQTAIQIGKGDDLLGRQKAAVLLIQAVLLKPAHMILAAARRFVQGAQRKGGALLGLQVCNAEFHCRFPHFLLEFILLYLGKVVK